MIKLSFLLIDAADFICIYIFILCHEMHKYHNYGQTIMATILII